MSSNESIKLTRDQVLNLAEAVNDDPNIAQVELNIDSVGKLRVNTTVLEPKTRAISLTKKRSKK